MAKDAISFDGVAARLAATLIGEAFLDMAVALGRLDSATALDIASALERDVVARLRRFGEEAGSGKDSTVRVQKDAAMFVRQITQEAKDRIVDRSGH